MLRNITYPSAIRRVVVGAEGGAGRCAKSIKPISRQATLTDIRAISVLPACLPVLTIECAWCHTQTSRITAFYCAIYGNRRLGVAT